MWPQLWPPGEENINYLGIQIQLCISEAIPRYEVKSGSGCIYISLLLVVNIRQPGEEIHNYLYYHPIENAPPENHVSRLIFDKQPHTPTIQPTNSHTNRQNHTHINKPNHTHTNKSSNTH